MKKTVTITKIQERKNLSIYMNNPKNNKLTFVIKKKQENSHNNNKKQPQYYVANNKNKYNKELSKQ